MATAYDRRFALVRRLPRGKLATYGQVARLAGIAPHARQVGDALHSLPNVPWQRVVNAGGEVSRRSAPEHPLRQRMLLEDEGVRFDARDGLERSELAWTPGES